MFGFGKKRPETYNDAKKIIASSNEEIIRSSWDLYAHIKKSHKEKYDEFDEKLFKKLTYTWEALKIVMEKEGDFSKFSDNEKHFLIALRDGHLFFSDLIHVLIEHHNDEKAAEQLFEQHPRLHKVIPPQYNNTQQLIEVLLEYVKQYQWDLEQYSMKHYGQIEKALGGAYDDEQVYVSRS